MDLMIVPFANLVDSAQNGLNLPHPSTTKPMLRSYISPTLAVLALIPLAAGQNANSPSPEGVIDSDWSAIQTAHQNAQHKAFSTEAGIQALNPRQGWLTTFDREGFLVEPNEGDWSWGLQLKSYGFIGAAEEVEGSAFASSDGNRIQYNWNTNLQEWYINDTRGLEHGYTLQERPTLGSSPDAPLIFDLEIQGSLSAEIHSDGKGIRFVNDQAATVVTYAGLHVFDANGVTQPAEFEKCGTGIRISVAESDAYYPLTVDPIAEHAYFKSSNPDENDRFGSSIAISGDIIVVGASGEKSNATGVNGNQNNNELFNAGAAYIFERIGGSWTQQAYLKASNTDALDMFGSAVAISGNLVAVGAWGEDSNTLGINGNQANNDASNSGAVYIFERVGGVWTQQAYLKASNADPEDMFGKALAVGNDMVVVGAEGEASNAIGFNGNQADNSASASGAVYVFKKTGGTWIQQNYIKASNSDMGDLFGTSLSISSYRLAVAASNEGSDAVGANGAPYNNNQPGSGAVYIFESIGSNWTQQAYLKATVSAPDLSFGKSLDITGNQLAATCIENAQIFEFSASGWAPSAQLHLTTPNPIYPSIYTSIAISGNRVLIGDSWESGGSSGINDPSSVEPQFLSGAAYLFERDLGLWSQRAFIKTRRRSHADQFGAQIAMSDDLAIIAVPGESSRSSGINGSQAYGGLWDSGAVFVYDLDSPQTNYCGTAVPNSSGLPGSISMSGSFAVADNAFSLHATDLPTGQFGYFLNSRGQGYVANPGGSQGDRCLGGGPPMGRHNRSGEVGFSGANGTLSLTLNLTDMPAPGGSLEVLAGEQWNFQCWFRDANTSGSSNFTDGLWVQFE